MASVDLVSVPTTDHGWQRIAEAASVGRTAQSLTSGFDSGKTVAAWLDHGAAASARKHRGARRGWARCRRRRLFGLRLQRRRRWRGERRAACTARDRAERRYDQTVITHWLPLLGAIAEHTSIALAGGQRRRSARRHERWGGGASDVVGLPPALQPSKCRYGGAPGASRAANRRVIAFVS